MELKKFMTSIDINKTILIGPTGFLGPSFLELNPAWTAVGRSPLPSFLENNFIQISDSNDFKKLDKADFEYVIFLIGSSEHQVLNDWKNSSLALQKNVIPLFNFLSYLKKSDRSVKKVVAFTTMLQYDSNKMILPVSEDQPINKFTNQYVFSKSIAEQVTEFFRNDFPIIDIRVSNVYGPTSLYRPDIVPSLIWKLLQNQSTSVWTKKPIRDFVYVKDVVSAVKKLMTSDFSGPVNVGSGVGSSVGELCRTLESLSQKKIYDENKTVSGHMEYFHDIKLLESITGWKPQFSLEKGLSETYEVMKLFYDKGLGPMERY